MNLEDERYHAQIIVSGRVQGVGFRASARVVALDMQLCGTVRNQADGSVEIWIAGSKTEVNDYLERLKKETLGRIDRTVVSYHLLNNKPQGFHIIY